MNKEKTSKFFSAPLMKQNIKSNLALTIAITAVMCLICLVSTYATSTIETNTVSEQTTEAQQDFYTYLYTMASYNEMAGTDLSYEDFSKSDDKAQYETVFEMASQQSSEELNIQKFEDSIKTLEDSDISMDAYVREFEYVYALQNVPGCFTHKDLSIDDMMETIFEVAGIDSNMMDTLTEMDTTSLFTRMEYTIQGLLPMLIFVVIVGNSLIVDQVDKGSMAYVLSTPTKRSAVAITQMLFMLVTPAIIIGITCITRMIGCYIFFDTFSATEIIVQYVGLYILTEAISGICYLGSCIFDQSKKAMAFGGGLTVWFFLASLLGMFGTSDMVNMGIGSEALNIFNKLTVVGLYDVNTISTLATSSPDYSFIPKLVILGLIAIVCYVGGSLIFKKKDLPL